MRFTQNTDTSLASQLAKVRDLHKKWHDLGAAINANGLPCPTVKVNFFVEVHKLFDALRMRGIKQLTIPHESS